MMFDSTVIKTICLVGCMAFNGIMDAVIEHKQSLPEEAQANTVYVTYLPWEGEAQRDLIIASNLMISSSSRQPVIEHSVPRPLGELPVAVLDLEALKWSKSDYESVLKTYPYLTDDSLIVVRAGWLLKQLGDGFESEAYRRLLLGTKTTTRTISEATTRQVRNNQGRVVTQQVPAKTETKTTPAASNLEELFELFSVGDNQNFGHIEAQSGVNKVGVRLIESRPIPRGYAWITYDALNLIEDFDPLERLDKSFKYDGSEIIIGIPKISLVTGDRGAAQIYFLADANGQLVNRAPVDLVEDTTRFRGYAEIRNPGSCIQCHTKGLNPPTESDYHGFVRSGGQAFAKYKERLALDAYYGGGINQAIERANEDYGLYVNVACEATPEEASAAFKRAITNYDRPLDLAQTAIELDTDPATWRTVIVRSGVSLNARLVGLAHGRTISRDAWEQLYGRAVAALEAVGPIEPLPVPVTDEPTEEPEDENISD